MKKQSKKTTALVRRHAKIPKVPKVIRPDVLPVVQTPSNILRDEVDTADLGLLDFRLTPEEDAILNRPVDVAQVRVKPTGALYLSHPTYTRLFNEAFGRLGWSIVPRSKPMRDGQSVVCPYILYIHGKPAAFAMGEQEYHPNNAEQTYGDALEATVASALRRCAKRLGVGLELWDPDWVREFERSRVAKVFVKEKDDKPKVRFRLKTSPPFWNETGVAGERRSDESRGQPATETSVAHNPHEEEPITEAQVKRLWVIIRRMGRTEPEVKIWLAAQGIGSSKAIKRKDYENICHALEHPGPLADPTREPGAEG